MDIQKIIAQMTDIEKATFLQGTDFMYTNKSERLGVPSLCLADGPHGLRKQIGDADNGVTESEPATAFPTAVNIASSFNPENARRMGEAIGEECRAYGVHILLGPGVCIKRNPLCGRNFEYYSEDPYVSGTMGTEFVKGVQSQGVGVAVKHFALNNQENYRFMGDSECDERAIREIYLKAFERIVKNAAPATVMCAYNKINGEYCSENKKLLTDVLRDEWGFDGFVMSDWGATHDRVKGVLSGLDLEMPGSTVYCRKLVYDALQNNTADVQKIDQAVERILKTVEKLAFAETVKEFDKQKHHDLATDIATDTAVLLKNEGIFPLKKEQRLFVVGELFDKMRYQGSGSSMIHPTCTVTPKNAFDNRKINYIYKKGYRANTEETDSELMDEVIAESKNHDAVLLFLGLTDLTESEGEDRQNMRLPKNQLLLIETLLKTKKKIAVVLFGGSPVELPFFDRISALLNMYLPGQGGGEATARLLFGEDNPSGKLAETWCKSYADVPYGDEYGSSEIELYKESIFVGYRYYGTKKVDVRFPFGYGQSYTSFAYDRLTVSKVGNKRNVSFTLTNNGRRDGKETVFLFVKNNPNSAVFKAEKELRAFTKVALRAGESKQICLSFLESDLAFYHIKDGWVLENGQYTVQICSSYDDIRLSEDIEITDGVRPSCPYSEELNDKYKEKSVSTDAFEQLIGHKIPAKKPIRPFHMDSRFGDFTHSFFGKLIFKGVCSVADKQYKEGLKMPEGTDRDNHIKGAVFLRRLFEKNSPMGLTMSAGDAMPYNFAEALVAIGNGRLAYGIAKLLHSYKLPK